MSKRTWSFLESGRVLDGTRIGRLIFLWGLLCLLLVVAATSHAEDYLAAPHGVWRPAPDTVALTIVGGTVPEPVLEVLADGRVRWRGRFVTTDTEFRKAMRDGMDALVHMTLIRCPEGKK